MKKPTTTKKPTKNWSNYQREVAAVFSALGLDATIEASVEGARGVHDVDVWVTFKRYGFETKWLVECKFWKSAVPKEKVLALHQIAQDVGADRAFLLSESGFQSGAIRVAQHTNISLLSLEDLKNETSEELFNSSLANITKKLAALDAQIRPFMFSDEGKTFPIPGPSKDAIISVSADTFLLKIGIPKAAVRDFPLYIGGSKGESTKVVEDISSFIKAANDVLNDVEAAIINLKQSATENIDVCLVRREIFINSVKTLLENGKEALFCQAEDGSADFERLRLISVQDMQNLSEIADAFKTVASGTIKKEFYALMRLIIDSVYLHLTKSRVPLDEWEQTELSVLDQIKRLNQASAAYVS